VRIVRGEVARLVVEDDRLTGVELTDGRVIARTEVFIRPGNLPVLRSASDHRRPRFIRLRPMRSFLSVRQSTCVIG
jgi:hypothetical protein